MQKIAKYITVAGTFYVYDSRIEEQLKDLRQRVNAMRILVGKLDPESIQLIRDYFRLKNIYNSNAIEGNMLTMGETKMVIREGLTITGKPLKDSVEARNLDHAIDFFEELAKRNGEAISVQDLRNIHNLILKSIDDQNAGQYRNIFVEISGSKYRPPDPAKLDDMMHGFGKWLISVSDPTQVTERSFTDPVVLACAAHAWFVYIHPFVDGNGRTARLLMNLILMRYGYPLTILTKDDRNRYYDALEISQDGGDLSPFIGLVLESALESIEVYEQAAKAQLQLQQSVQALVAQNENALRIEHQIFENAMGILKGYFQQTVRLFTEAAEKSLMPDRIAYKDFGVLEFEKYQSLRISKSAKKTWFFRLTLYNNDVKEKEAVRYLFFFGFASADMASKVGEKEVTLHIATEVYPFYYDRLAELDSTDLPTMLEISYLPDEEHFIYLDRSGTIKSVKAEQVAKEFITKALSHFR